MKSVDFPMNFGFQISTDQIVRPATDTVKWKTEILSKKPRERGYDYQSTVDYHVNRYLHKVMPIKVQLIFQAQKIFVYGCKLNNFDIAKCDGMSQL